jgi:crotonobetainyl-CoA:carnitine CoA-transferase CaiB-like acyl-CoA transferase
MDDPRLADASAIRRHRTEIIALLDEIIGELPLAEWAARFDQEGVWWAPAQTPPEVVGDPQLAANDGFVEIDGGAAGGQRSVNGPVTFAGTTRGRVASVPGLGQHTEEVLRERPGRGGEPSAEVS